MRKISTAAVLVVVTISVALLIALVPVTNSVIDDELANVTPQPDQAEFVAHYQLARLYEENGQLEKAQEQYEEAARSTQPEILAAGQEGLRRVLLKQADWRRLIRARLQTAIAWALQFILVLALLIVASVILWGAWQLLRWVLTRLKPEAGYQILLFEDYTGDGLGQNGHLLVHALFQDVQKTYQQAKETLMTQLGEGTFPLISALAPSAAATTDALQVIDKVSVAGVEVKLLPLWATLRSLDFKEYNIVNQLYRQGNRLRLVTEVRRTAENRPVEDLSLCGDPTKSLPEQMGDLVEQMAFQFLVCADDQARLGTRSWRALQLFTQGLQVQQRYLKEAAQISLLSQAADLFKQALELDPNWQAAGYALGSIYNMSGQYKAAEEVFTRLPNDGRLALASAYSLGYSLYHQFRGNWSRRKAYEQFKKVVDTIDQRTRDQQQQLLLALTHCDIAVLAALEIQKPKKEWTFEPRFGRMELVQQHTQKAEDLAGDLEKSVQPIIRAALNHALGEAYCQQDDKEKAREYLNKSIKERSNFPLTYISMANTYLEDSDERIAQIETAIRIQPGFEYAYLKLGEAYDQRYEGYKHKDPEAAREERDLARQAYQQAPSYADAHNKLGEYLIKDGDYEGGMKEFKRAVELNRYCERAWDNMAWRTLQAIEEGIIPKTEQILQNVSEWSRRYKELVEGREQEWKAHDLLGWTWLVQGRIEAAEQELVASVALEEGQKQMQSWYHLALVYRAKGDREQAKQKLNEALKCRGSATIRVKAEALQRQLEYDSH